MRLQPFVIVSVVAAHASAAAAQDHSHHGQRAAPMTNEQAGAEPPPEPDHSNHGQHSGHDARQQIETEPPPQPDHSQIDHSAMGHGPQNVLPLPLPDVPAPAENGPTRAADAIWGAEAMRASRAQLAYEQGGQTFASFRADRFEYRAGEGDDGFLWDLDAWYGGDIDKLWLKSEGEGAFGDDIEDADIQALWSRAITPWFDVQAGVRQDLTGPSRTYAVLGLQGLAPYLFEVDGALFLSNKGDLTATVEAELDQRITQRLVLQPRGEITVSAQDVPELGIGAGIDTIEAGLRLRYEFVREFAPYIGIEQSWKLGDSADFARLDGEETSATNYVVGVRFWF